MPFSSTSISASASFATVLAVVSSEEGSFCCSGSKIGKTRAEDEEESEEEAEKAEAVMGKTEELYVAERAKNSARISL